MLGVFAGQALAGQVHQNQVVVRAAGNQVKTCRQQFLSQSLRIGQNLLAIFLKAGLQSLAQGNRLGGNHMH